MQWAIFYVILNIVMAKKTASRAPSGILRDPIFIQHRTDDYHPESPERLVQLYKMLDSWPEAKDLELAPSRKATEEELKRIHTKRHIEMVAATADMDSYHLDGDTPTSPKSYEAALFAAGGSIELTDRVLDGGLANGFGLVRPPGHHAEAERAMGFCLFNNVAIAAAHARDKRNLSRILIVDWDIHHGNGTQHSFYNDNRVMYFSAHQYPYYPGTGHYQEVGEGAGEGYTINVPLPPGQGDAEYYAIFEKILKPIALEYKPQIIFVSAGFDAYEHDPLGHMRITVPGYTLLASSLGAIADEVCGGKIVYLLEGGYNISGLVESIQGILRFLMGKTDPDSIKIEERETVQMREYLNELSRLFGNYWKSLK